VVQAFVDDPRLRQRHPRALGIPLRSFPCTRHAPRWGLRRMPLSLRRSRPPSGCPTPRWETAVLPAASSVLLCATSCFKKRPHRRLTRRTKKRTLPPGGSSWLI
jgi:hypothetical protein